MELVVGNLVARFTAETAEFRTAMKDATRVTADTQRAMAESATEVSGLQTRLRALTESYKIGRIGESEYAAGLKTLRADIKELGATTDLTAETQRRLAGVAGTVTRNLRGVTMDARRTAQGFEAFGVATNAAALLATGGIGGIQAAASRLQIFALGNPWLVGILTGLSALAAAYELIAKKSHEATAETWRLGQGTMNVSVNQMAEASFKRWVDAAVLASQAMRGTQAFSRLNAEAETAGRRYFDTLAQIRRMFAAGVEMPENWLGGSLRVEHEGRKAGTAAARAFWEGFGRLQHPLGVGPIGPTIGSLNTMLERNAAAERMSAVSPSDLTRMTNAMTEAAVQGANAMDPLIQGVVQLGHEITRTAQIAATLEAPLRIAFETAGRAIASGGQNVWRAVHDALRAIAIEAAARAAFEAAAALGATAWGNLPGAALHWAAARQYAATALIAGAGAAGIGVAGGGGPRGGAGGDNRGAGSSYSGSGGSQSPIIINNYLVAEDGRQLAPMVTSTVAEYEALGGRAPGVSHVARVPALVLAHRAV